jgi:NADPH-dependent 2,4-dienoyl-CoA reductase/sulfur reductase-like enzyme
MTMMMKRRALLLHAGAALAAAQLGAPAARATAAARKVVVAGAGWGGLAAAQALRRLAPEIDVHVVDRDPLFRSLPLSNAWLVGRTPERVARVALPELARRHGWRFSADEVVAIDRERRSVRTRAQRLDYDWLVLATGAAADHGAWFGDDAQAALLARTKYPAGFAAAELDTVKAGLEAFAAAGGGTLAMTVPPAPYRCPPAPYERAALIGWWIKARKLNAKLVLIDAGGGMPRYNRLFAERHAGRIEHVRHAGVRAVDPRAKTIDTDAGMLRYDHALLLPPMHAGALVAQAGLLGRDSQDRPTRWAAADPATLRSPHDERVYLVGDALDSVSLLFGHYPKTAQIAADLGAAAAAQIAAAARGDASPPAAGLPSSQCHVWLDAEPAEQLVIETNYRRRGDGVIAQTVRQIDNPQPRDEDLAWARGVMRERLGVE